VLTPAGRGIAWAVRGTGAGLAALVRWTPVAPAVTGHRYVLLPAGRALVAVVPVVARETGAACGLCRRAAGYVSRAVGRFHGRLLRGLVVEPSRRAYRAVRTPLGHGIRHPARRAAGDAGRTVRRTPRAARAGARQTRREIRHALFGAPREPEPAVAAPPRREPGVPAARTLGKKSGRDPSSPTRGRSGPDGVAAASSAALPRGSGVQQRPHTKEK
jgi:hypothetical protein